MLTFRSKMLVAVAAAAILLTVVGYVLSRTFWMSEPAAEDSYIGWIVLGVVILAAVASIAIDVRRSQAGTRFHKLN